MDCGLLRRRDLRPDRAERAGDPGLAELDRVGPISPETVLPLDESFERRHEASPMSIALRRSSRDTKHPPSAITFQLRAMPLARSQYKLGSV